MTAPASVDHQTKENHDQHPKLLTRSHQKTNRPNWLPYTEITHQGSKLFHVNHAYETRTDSRETSITAQI